MRFLLLDIIGGVAHPGVVSKVMKWCCGALKGTMEAICKFQSRMIKMVHEATSGADPIVPQ